MLNGDMRNGDMRNGDMMILWTHECIKFYKFETSKGRKSHLEYLDVFPLLFRKEIVSSCVFISALNNPNE